MNGSPTGDLNWHPAKRHNWAGREVLVVGGTAGIGRAIAQELAKQKAKVIVVGRTFRDQNNANISFLQADLSSLKAAREAASNIDAQNIELVIFTTGIIAAPTRIETEEGIEQDMAISYLSRFVMLRELSSSLGRAKDTAPRVFVMGFPGTGEKGNVDDANSERSYKALPSHMNTVAGNEALVLDANTRYPHIDVFGLNPGLVRKTGIRGNLFGGNKTLRHRLFENMIGWFPSAQKYASTIVPLLGAEELSGRSGTLFNKKGRAIHPSEGFDAKFVGQWMAVSEQLVAKAIEH